MNIFYYKTFIFCKVWKQSAVKKMCVSTKPVRRSELKSIKPITKTHRAYDFCLEGKDFLDASKNIF